MRKAPRRPFRPLALEPIEPRRLLAFGAELVADINTLTYSPATNPAVITDVSGLGYYVAKTSAQGYELWKSDGTAAGTTLVKDILPGPQSSSPRQLTNVNGTLFFTVNTPDAGLELWTSDGTEAGTQLFKDINPTGSSAPADLVNFNGTLYFTADDGLHGRELWKSDGTPDGTAMVRELRDGVGSADPNTLIPGGNLLYFLANDIQNRLRLWRTDGTGPGTFRVTDVAPSGNFAELNGSLYFTVTTAGEGEELWATNGVYSNGTRVVADINGGPASSHPRELTNVNGTLFFRADDGVHGDELWKSDGLPGGTAMVRDLDVGPIGYPGSFGPTNLINFNGTLFFTNQNRSAIWKSDGSELGTVPVVDAQPSSLSIRSTFTVVGSSLFFANHDSESGTELWKSDGTAAGSLQVRDINSATHPDYGYPYSSDPGGLVAVAGRLMFGADDGQGHHLWTSDGTESGTRILDDAEIWTYSGRVRPLGDFNGKLLLSSTGGLYATDGTPAGTTALASGAGGSSVTVIGGQAFISADYYEYDSGEFKDAWRTDGTPTGTVLLKRFGVSNYYGGSSPYGYTELRDKVLFVGAGSANDSYATGRALWSTNGTATGTSLLKDVYITSELARIGDSVYFAARDVYRDAPDKDFDYELWRTDGTSAGTVLVKNINPQVNEFQRPQSSNPYELHVLGNKLLFTADDGVHGRELWSSDGTAAGTVLVRDLVPGGASSGVANLTVSNGKLYFTTVNRSRQMNLWRSDGTAAGTQLVAAIGSVAERDFYYNSSADEYRYRLAIANVGGMLYFFSDRAANTGRELWRSDGTTAGTRLVEDTIPGPTGPEVFHLQSINNVLFYEVAISERGRDLWISNGTAEGTHSIDLAGTGVKDNEYGGRYLASAGGTIYFAGTDVEHGQELWKLTTAQPQVTFSGTINHRENEPLRLLAPFATITDADNARFTGGQLKVAVTKNPSPGDRFEVRHQGDAAGQIGVAARWIRYGGVTIGSYRIGESAGELLIDLNLNATVAATQALLRNIGYRNDSDNPSTNPRRVTVTLTDGSGGISVPISKTINVIATNDAPRLVLGGQIAYKNNTAPILLAAAASVSDIDSANFAGGLLTVAITSGDGAGNRLWVSGAYSLQGNRLLRNGILMGTVVENGNGWNNLKLRFNTNMTAPLVQELVRSLRFRTVNNTNLSPRTIEFTLTDGDGGVSAKQTKRVNLTA